MSDHDTADTAPKSAADKLAEALARKRGGSGAGAPVDAASQRRNERGAAAASAAKNRPAPRKG